MVYIANTLMDSQALDYKALRNIVTYMQEKVGRKLTYKELENVLLRYKNGLIKPVYAEQKKASMLDLHEHQVTEIYKDYDKTTQNNESNDTSEDQMGQSDPSSQVDVSGQSLDVINILGISNLTDLQLLINPSSLYEHIYVGLDSDYRDTTQDSGTTVSKFIWKYAPTQNVGVGFCNSVGEAKNIIGMRMYQPKIPFLSDMDTDAKRVSILIEEMKSQAYIASNGRRFHFLLRPVYVPSQTNIELSTEDYNDGIFNFRKPIKHIDSLTISFGNPLDILNFPIPVTPRFIVVFEFTCLKID